MAIEVTRDEILSRNPARWDGDGPLFIASLSKAMRVLYAFGGNDSRLSATNIARLSGLDPSSAQRFIYTLTSLGFLEKEDGTKRYKLSARLLDFAYLYLRSDPLCAVATPHVHRLAMESGERVNLSILDRADVIYVARQEGRRERDSQNLVGGRMPSFWTSNGRVLLAGLRRDEALAIIEAADRTPLTPRDSSDPLELIARVDEARIQGWAFVDEESELGSLSIAVPVTDSSGRVLAALNTPVDKREWTFELMVDRLLPALVHTAGVIGRSLSGMAF
jgi:DNA-binding IclR family transcriptional regulator